jgi:hypothetical protein
MVIPVEKFRLLAAPDGVFWPQAPKPKKRTAIKEASKGIFETFSFQYPVCERKNPAHFHIVGDKP